MYWLKVKSHLVFLLSIALGSILFSCTSDKEYGPIDVQKGGSHVQTSGVYIVNEGNFNWGNATISFYDPKSKSVVQQVFKKANQRPLGDVAQSMRIVGDKAFIVVNNSRKIEVVDQNTLKGISHITGFNSPRYYLQIDSEKAYVSELYKDKIYVVNPTTGKHIKEITVKGWTEEMLLHEHKVYVQNVRNKSIEVINATTDQLIKTISLKDEPVGIVKDQLGKIYSLTKNELIVIENNASGETIKKYPMPEMSKPARLRIDSKNERLYFLSSGVRFISLKNTAYQPQLLIALENKNFYGLGIDPSNGDVYVANAKDYVQTGVIEHYTKGGKLQHQFEAGVIPQNMIFKQ